MKETNEGGLRIGDARPEEFEEAGQLLVRVYGALPGFPTPIEQPGYYAMLANVGQLTDRPKTRLLVARTSGGRIAGAVVYFGDMADYGASTATQLRDASGIRLLGVGDEWRGHGVGKALTQACIDLARQAGHSQVVLHTTDAMKLAWGMYERLGFARSPDLDFVQGIQVYGFRKPLR